MLLREARQQLLWVAFSGSASCMGVFLDRSPRFLE